MKLNKNAITAAVIAVAAIAAFFLFSGRSYTATVDQYVEAQFEADSRSIFELVPDDILAYMMRDEGYEELTDMIHEANEELRDNVASLNNRLGSNWKLTHKITSSENVTGDELDELKSIYRDFDVKVSAAKTIEVECELKVEGEVKATRSFEVSLIKVGRSWYLDMDSMGGF